MGLENLLYSGFVYHKRFVPKVHELKNRVFFIKFSLNDLEKMKNSIFSINRWNILSFWNKDHGFRDGKDLKNWAHQRLIESGIKQVPTDLVLMTFPRVLGYVFNPVSFWFCYHGNQHFATIAEVNNTFGNTHSYVIDSQDKNYDKEFHVSPFFKIEGYYKFKFDLKSKKQIIVLIDYYKDGVCQLKTLMQGHAIEWSSWNLFKQWLSHPAMTFVIVFLIHWHALLLITKKIPFFGKNGI